MEVKKVTVGSGVNRNIVPAAVVGFVIGFTLWSYLKSVGVVEGFNYALLFGVVGAVASALGGIISTSLTL